MTSFLTWVIPTYALINNQIKVAGQKLRKDTVGIMYTSFQMPEKGFIPEGKKLPLYLKLLYFKGLFLKMFYILTAPYSDLYQVRFHCHLFLN